MGKQEWGEQNADRKIGEEKRGFWKMGGKNLRMCTGRGKIRVERKLEGEEKRKPERKGKEPGVIYASLGTRLYLFFPASCFTSAI